MKELLNSDFDRRELLKVGGFAGLSMLGAGLLAGCGGSTDNSASKNRGDQAILGAAKIAEALATATYTGFINSGLFSGLSTDDAFYITAARDEEKIHYDVLKSVTGNTDAQTTYYLPTNMFVDFQTTLDTINTLEEAFIAAYLVGVRNLSTPALRVIAAQILGVETEHRTLLRVTAKDQGLTALTGLDGTQVTVSPANNTVFERTFGLTDISQAVTVLTPFLSQSASHSVAVTFDPTYVPPTTNLVGLTP